MANIFFIGDSIRIGYDEFAIRILEGRGHTVNISSVNNGDSTELWAALNGGSLDSDGYSVCDTVIYNTGIHDVQRDGDPANPMSVTAAQYITNHTNIANKFVSEKKRFVFVTTTWVDEAVFADPYWFNADIVTNDTEAKAIVAARGGYVIDLRSNCIANHTDAINGDGIHYDAAYAWFGFWIGDKILKILGDSNV